MSLVSINFQGFLVDTDDEDSTADVVSNKYTEDSTFKVVPTAEDGTFVVVPTKTQRTKKQVYFING